MNQRKSQVETHRVIFPPVKPRDFQKGEKAAESGSKQMGGPRPYKERAKGRTGQSSAAGQ
jgi:hypothetical protein